MSLAALGVGGLALGGCSAPDTAPAVSYTLLDGSTHALADQRGKVMLVNFWATSCTTCVKEMPALVATHQRFAARSFDTLAVAMSYDPPAYVSQFAQTRALPFGVALDTTGAVAEGFGGIRLTPTTFLLDKHQRVVKRYVGEPEWDALHALIDELLAQPA